MQNINIIFVTKCTHGEHLVDTIPQLWRESPLPDRTQRIEFHTHSYHLCILWINHRGHMFTNPSRQQYGTIPPLCRKLVSEHYSSMCRADIVHDSNPDSPTDALRPRGRHCLRVVSSIVSLLSSTALVFLYFFGKDLRFYHYY